ncbi:MAG: DUF4160 domain-containing protein [Candidatus Rokubacteria bacterium]|nr:DUF4160 domain-containing protein [Candidatus Rokubacteria bacterium]
MFAEPTGPHHRPPFQAYYQEEVGIFAIGRFVEAWAEIHHAELLVAWEQLQAGRPLGKIEPLMSKCVNEP